MGKDYDEDFTCVGIGDIFLMTCLATACCCHARSDCWPPSTTAISSSIRIPTQKPVTWNASACSRCRARPGPITTPA
ncbi:MAG: hypothetical protein R3F18_05805 [Lysobacterales bacterium]